MPSTLTHKISYPSGTVAPNVPVVMQTTAESVDSALVALKPTAAVVTAGVVQSIPNAAWTKLTYDTTETNSGTNVSLSGGTITVAKAGLYAITVSGGTQATTSGAFGIRTEVGGAANATTLFASSPSGSSGTAMTYVYLPANSVVSASIWQSSGVARTVSGARLTVAQVSGL